MNEMVERVAKAIQAKCRERGYKECPAPLVHHVAAAAIEAMREPTEEMTDLGHSEIIEGGDIHSAWAAMIDAALDKVKSSA